MVMLLMMLMLMLWAPGTAVTFAGKGRGGAKMGGLVLL